MVDGTFVDELAARLAGVEAIEGIGAPDGVAVLSVPSDFGFHEVDFARYAPNPRRMTGKATLRDEASFVLYVDRYTTPATLIYADHENKRFRAIINGHAKEDAGWGDHTATFEPRWTPSWTAWTGNAGGYMAQGDFADFLEDRIGDIAEPDGAVLLETIRAFRLHTNVKYERVIDGGSDRIDFRYVEEDNTAGSVLVPEKLTLIIAPFDGAEPEKLTARLRYERPTPNKPTVRFRWELGEEPRRILDRAMGEMAVRIQAATGVSVLRGSFENA